MGRLVVPSKWPQKPFASTTLPISSLGTEEGRVLERDVVVADVISTRFHKYEQNLNQFKRRGGAHNLMDS